MLNLFIELCPDNAGLKQLLPAKWMTHMAILFLMKTVSLMSTQPVRGEVTTSVILLYNNSYLNYLSWIHNFELNIYTVLTSYNTILVLYTVKILLLKTLLSMTEVCDYIKSTARKQLKQYTSISLQIYPVNYLRYKIIYATNNKIIFEALFVERF